MAQKSKAKNYKTNNLRKGVHHTHGVKDEPYIVWHFNSTVVALDEAILTYKRFNDEGMPVRICMKQIEVIEQLLITCFIILNGVDSYEFVNPSYERIMREALNIIA